MKGMFSFLLPLIIVLFGCSSENPVQPPANGQYFIVQVGRERFTMFVTDPPTIQFATENFQGKNHKFPTGRISLSNGGFNSPWSWHFQPDNIRMADVAIEVCDGLPSHVNSHLNDYLATGYCPWSAKVIQVGR